jgi:RNA polymerase sigma-70 factor (ECF subfamily)
VYIYQRNLSEEVGINEAGLVSSASQGNAAAWEGLVRLYQEPVFRLAYLILGDEAEAEDAAQEAFIRAYLKLDQFDAERPLRPWLLSIAANLARNRRRSMGRYWAALQRFWQHESVMKQRPGEPAGQVEARRLWQAVRQLRPKAQEIIYLRYFLELSEAETAATLKIARGTVKSRLHRALKQLRTVIESDFPDLSEAFR